MSSRTPLGVALGGPAVPDDRRQAVAAALGYSVLHGRPGPDGAIEVGARVELVGGPTPRRRVGWRDLQPA